MHQSRFAALTTAAFIGFTSVTFAADLPTKAPVDRAPVTTVYNWSGCYLGAQGGYGWGRSQHIAKGTIDGVVNPTGPAGTPITEKYRVDGGLAGGEVGCNLQNDRWVFGVEGDGSWSGMKGSSFDIPPFTVTTLSTTEQRWFATARGRIGYAFDSAIIIHVPVLFYITGGAAFAGLDIGVLGSNPVTESHTATGWTVGYGSEYALSGNWSLKSETLYARFSDTASHQFVATTNYRDVPMHQWVWRIGLNYRFGGDIFGIH